MAARGGSYTVKILLEDQAKPEEQQIFGGLTPKQMQNKATYLRDKAKKSPAKSPVKKTPAKKHKSSSAWTPSESVALEAGVKAHGASEYPPLFKPEPPPIAAAWKRVSPADPPSPENG
jgi:DNA replication initiation complex subunit (GINS family)